jgi:small neutral amino acid transporter SnatA (MarC family)
MTRSGRKAMAIACGMLMSVAALGGAQLSNLQLELEDVEIGGGWLYGDLDAGFAQAKETGQPLFVLFR